MAKQNDTEDSDQSEEDKRGADKKNAKRGPKAKSTDPNASKQKKHGNRGKIAAIAALIIVLALVYLYFTYGSIPTAILSGSLSPSAIETLALQKLYSNNMVSLLYSGTATINSTDPYLNISFLKYYNNTRASVTFSQFPYIANESVIVIAINNGSTGYSCQNIWHSAAAENSSYFCTATNNYGTRHIIADTFDTIANISTITNLHVNSYGVSLWNWQPCYSLSGTGSIMMNGALVDRVGTYIDSNFNFSACISAQYDIPLTLQGTVDLGNNQFMHFHINETSMNFTTTESQVTSLPPQTT